MKQEFIELYDSFKNLDDNNKKRAIIDFLKNNITSMQQINNSMNNTNNFDIGIITKAENGDDLDIIYKLLHVFTEQVEGLAEKIDKEFYE